MTVPEIEAQLRELDREISRIRSHRQLPLGGWVNVAEMVGRTGSLAAVLGLGWAVWSSDGIGMLIGVLGLGVLIATKVRQSDLEREFIANRNRINQLEAEIDRLQSELTDDR